MVGEPDERLRASFAVNRHSGSTTTMRASAGPTMACFIRAVPWSVLSPTTSPVSGVNRTRSSMSTSSPSLRRPLVVADPGDLPYVRPEPAILGGGFDSRLQSPIACRISPDGTRELVSVHAENIDATSVPWQWHIHTTTMVLRGEQLVVISTDDSKGTFSMGEGVFRNGCP